MALQLVGTVANFFKKAETKDLATGEVRPEQHRVQIMSADETGKMELVDLRVHDVKNWEGLSGKEVVVPVKMYNVDGSAGLYTAKDVKPVQVK